MIKQVKIPVVGPLHFHEQTLDSEIHELIGYAHACSDYGIWKDGQQFIGCLPIPVAEAIMQKWAELRQKYRGAP